MARPTKKEQIPNLPQAIKQAAWEQIAQHGAAALSLRAIARQLGITAPAIYNYYPSRDDLVTALIVEAFESLGESQIEAIRPLPPEDPTARFTALGLAYRTWALAYPQRYQLIFGTPIPHYHAPEEVTLPAAAASLMPLIQTLQTCQTGGHLRPGPTPATPALQAMLAAWSQVAGGVSPQALYTALVFWTRVHGLVSLEIGQQFPSLIHDPGEVFRREIADMQAQFLIP